MRPASAAGAVPQDNQTRTNAAMHAKLSGLHETVAKTAGLLDAVARNVTASAKKAEAAEKEAASKASGSIPEVAEVRLDGAFLSASDLESYFNRIVKVTGHVLLPGVSTINGAFAMAKLREVGESLVLPLTGSVKKVTFDSLVQIGDDLQGGSALESLVFKSLTTIKGYITMSGCNKLTSLTFPKLTRVGRYINFAHNNLLRSLSLPKLASVGHACPNPNVYDSHCGYFNIANNKALRSLTATAITKIGGYLNLERNGPSKYLKIGITCAKLKAAAARMSSPYCEA